jgi:hypothetical protein
MYMAYRSRLSPSLLSVSQWLHTLVIHHVTKCIATVKRKKSIELSKEESMSLYTEEPGPGTPWKSMEVYGLEIPSCYMEQR